MKIPDEQIQNMELLAHSLVGTMMAGPKTALLHLLAEREELMKESRERMLALESLTCGGSEFVGDIERCVEYVRRGQESMRQGLGKVIEKYKTRADTAESDAAALREEIERLEAKMHTHPNREKFLDELQAALRLAETDNHELVTRAEAAEKALEAVRKRMVAIELKYRVIHDEDCYCYCCHNRATEGADKLLCVPLRAILDAGKGEES